MQTGKFSLLTAVETLLEELKGTGGQQLAVKHPSHGNSKVMVRLEEKPMEPLNLVTPIKIKNEQRGEPAYHRNKRVYFLSMKPTIAYLISISNFLIFSKVFPASVEGNSCNTRCK